MSGVFLFRLPSAKSSNQFSDTTLIIRTTIEGIKLSGKPLSREEVGILALCFNMYNHTISLDEGHMLLTK